MREITSFYKQQFKIYFGDMVARYLSNKELWKTSEQHEICKERKYRESKWTGHKQHNEK